MRKRKRQKAEKTITSEPIEPIEIEFDDSHVIGVLVDLFEGSAIKFVNHRGYDKLLCEHVYHGFCPDCPQYLCEKRAL